MINFLKIVAKNRLAAFGGILLLIILTLSILAPILPLKEPNITNTADRFMVPFEGGHILGTDHLGRDLLSRLLWGTQLSLAVGFAAAFIAATFGSILGAIAGFYGQKTDNIIAGPATAPHRWPPGPRAARSRPASRHARRPRSPTASP